MNRREFFKRAGQLAVGAVGAAVMAPEAAKPFIYHRDALVINRRGGFSVYGDWSSVPDIGEVSVGDVFHNTTAGEASVVSEVVTIS